MDYNIVFLFGNSEFPPVIFTMILADGFFFLPWHFVTPLLQPLPLLGIPHNLLLHAGLNNIAPLQALETVREKIALRFQTAKITWGFTIKY